MKYWWEVKSVKAASTKTMPEVKEAAICFQLVEINFRVQQNLVQGGHTIRSENIRTSGDLCSDQLNASQLEIETGRDLVLPATWKNVLKKIKSPE